MQTVIIETDSLFLTKGWPVYRKPCLPMHYRVRLGRRFEAPPDGAVFMNELEQYFAAELGTPGAACPGAESTANAGTPAEGLAAARPKTVALR